MAQAMPKPSLVLVPLPSQSISTSELEVAVSSMQALSIISLIKVEMPRTWRSEAPTLVMMASTIGVLKSTAGTQQPMWARQAHTPTVRMYVDLPPMLGPVRTIVLCLTNSTSLGTQFLRQGCLMLCPERPVEIEGRHQTAFEVPTTEAKVVRTSSSLRIRESSYSTGQQPATSSNILLSSTCCSLLYSSSTTVSLSQSLVRASVTKVILVCLAVRNLQPGVYLTFPIASFLLPSSTNLWLFDGTFSISIPRYLATFTTS